MEKCSRNQGEETNMYHLIYGILLLALTCICKGLDVVLTATSDCYNVNDNMALEAEYKGSTTIDGVMWTVTGGSSTMLIIVSTCSPYSIPSGFPYGRMSHDCSFAPKYRLTIQPLESADFNKTWGVDFSLLVGSTASGRQQQKVTQCETINESSTGFPWWTIGLIVLVIGVVAATLYGVYCQLQCLKEPVDQSLSFQSINDIKRSVEVMFNNKLNEKHIPCTSEADREIRQWPEINPTDEPTDEPNTRLMSLGAHVENEDIRHQSDNNGLPEERRRLTNEANEDIQQRNEINFAKEFDEKNPNEEISNGVNTVECNQRITSIPKHCSDSAKEFYEKNHNEEISNGDEAKTRSAKNCGK